MSEPNAGVAANDSAQRGKRKDRRTATFLLRLALPWMAVAIYIIDPTTGQAEDRIESYRATREDYIANFRVTGRHDPAPLVRLERDLQLLVPTTSGEDRTRALLELGEVQRLANEFPEAVSTLGGAAESAARLGQSALAFDAWIGVARAHIVGTHNHGAAQAAMDSAEKAAGPTPSAKQRYKIALYNAEGAAARGETETALGGALDAVRLASTPEDRFSAELDVGDVLEKLADSCDYRPLRDKRSVDDGPGDAWGACRRAIDAARSGYTRAATTADGLGWKYLAGTARQFIRSLEVRRWIVEQHAQGVAASVAGVLAPHDKKDVLVERGDLARGMLLGDRKGIGAGNPALIAAMEQTLAEADKAPGGTDNARSLYLRGVLAEMRGSDTAQATLLYTQAAALLSAQRAGLFDATRRGTVIESSMETFRDLTWRLLVRHRDAEAFGVLETIRARGLSEMRQALRQPDVTDADRAWLAQLLRLEALSSAAETLVSEHVVADGRFDGLDDKLIQWEKSEADRRLYLLGRPLLRSRLAKTAFSPVTLSDLEQAAGHNGIPVLLYWVANPNIIIWYLGPNGSEFRVVFLPEAELSRKIAQLVGTIDQPAKTFDEKIAKELYLYLIAPFEDLIDGKQLMIVPQGPIVGLPFEALVQPAGGFLIDRWAVSYAPNATIAYQALQRPAPKITRVTGIFDPELIDTGEQQDIGSVAGLRLTAASSADVLPDKLNDSVRGAESVHLLLHGEFDPIEPLLSRLIETSHRSPPLPATALLALPLSGVKLVVLSACESGVVAVRISNEIYGFPWALLAGGAENVVTSRWRVDGSSNGKWMRSFYAAIAQGSSPAEAAATAMRTMKEGQGSPYFWAAMAVSGR